MTLTINTDNHAYGNPARVLLTRAPADNRQLAEQLGKYGVTVRELPLLDIQPLTLTPADRQQILNLDLYDMVISTSQHASRNLLDKLDEYWPQLPVGIAWYAMGEASAAPLREAGLTVNLPMAGNTSEHLLRRPELQNLKGKRILLAKGVGGRDLIASTLQDRGARLEALELYARHGIDYEEPELRAALDDWQPGRIVILSGEALEQLWSLGTKIDYAWKATCFIVPSERVATKLRSRGLMTEIAPTMQPEALAEFIVSLDTAAPTGNQT